MRKIISVIIFAILTICCYAQQDPQFSQNMFIKLPINPGYAGTSGAICATTAYRTQWVGFPGAPKTFFLSADMPVPIIYGGVGLIIMNDKLGNYNFILARGAYSYHKIIGQTGLLGIGIDAGIFQASVADKWIPPQTPIDPRIPDDKVSKLTYDVGFGAYYRTNQLFVGLSFSHLPGGANGLKAEDFDYKTARHYYVIAGYDFFLSSTFTLRPSAHVKSDAAITTFDINCNLLWNNMIWLGASYRLKDAIVPMVGFVHNPNQKSTLKIGYSYDIGTSDLKTHHSNTHEILVNYCMKIIPKSKIQSHINPRFLR
ncbi:MAG: type IX secretion system membrane protein PorP/SprF [Bacteroidota bacterium]